MKLFRIGIFFLTSLGLQAQSPRAALHSFFEAIHLADTMMMKATLHPLAQLQTVNQGRGVHPPMNDQQLLSAISRLTPYQQTEKIWQYDIRIDGHLAHAWLPYSFYFRDSLSHCGVNSVTLVQSEDLWQILHIIDTRHGDCSWDQRVEHLDSLISSWHHAAAIADGENYFGAMTPDAIFLGTDPQEKWSATAFEIWAHQYFEDQKTWDFEAISREFYFSKDETVVWFDEVLETWMGDCRGSGVLEMESDGRWMLRHYNLSILVPNEMVNSYLDLLRNSEDNKEDK